MSDKMEPENFLTPRIKNGEEVVLELPFAKPDQLSS